MTENGPTRQVRTACPAHCGIDACGVLAHVRGDRVIKVEPAQFPDPKYRRICLRGLSSLDITYHPDRLKRPLRRVGERGRGGFEPITWEEAFDIIADRFREIADKYGWPAIGWTLGGPGAGTTKFGAYLRLAGLTKSTRVSAWGYGDAGLPCGSKTLFGTHLPYALLFPKLMQDPDLVVVWGSNPAETQPVNMMRPIMDAKQKGARLVVIDPRFTVTAAKADAYLGLKPGTDTALGLGLMHVIFKERLSNEAFIRRHTVGPYLVRQDTGEFLRGKHVGLEPGGDYVVWDRASDSARLRYAPDIEPAMEGSYTVGGIEQKTALQMLMDLAEKYNPQKTAEITGVSRDLIVKLARRIGRSKTAAFVTNMGFTRTYHGDISARAMGSVAVITGHISATFRGGHRPAVLSWKPFLNPDPERGAYSRLGILQLYDAIEHGRPYPVKALYLAFTNFLNQCAHSGRIAERLFPALEFIVTAELFMTPTARYADIVLPTTSYLEFSDLIPFPYPYVQLQQKVIEPLHECRSDVDIAAGIAERLGFGEYFQGGEDAFIDLILDSGDDSMQGITRDKLRKGPMVLNLVPDLGQEIDIPFSTPSGKIELYSESLAEAGQALPVHLDPVETPLEPKGRNYPLAFIQGHSRFRTHSMFSNVESILELCPEPEVEINPLDAAERNIAAGDMVTVFNDRARTTLKARVTPGLRPGVVNITEGWWIEQFVEGSVNHLTHDVINPVQEAVYEPNMHMNDVAVEVVRAEEAAS